MSRFVMRLKIFLMLAFCIGVKGEANQLSDCLEMIEYQGSIETFLKLAAEEKFDVTCSNLSTVIICMNEVVRKQVGYDIKILASLLKGTEIGKGFQVLANMEDLTEEMCTEETHLRKDYLKDVKCFQNLYEDALEKCQKEAAVAFAIFRHQDTEENFDHAVDEPCVNTIYKLGCLGADIRDKCGNRAFNKYNEVVKRIGFFKDAMCSKNLIRTLNTTILESLEKEESRKSVYHRIFAQKKRRK